MNHTHSQKSPAGITLVDGKVLHRIPLADILFIQSDHIYVRFFLKDGRKILHRAALRSILQQLPARSFRQIHRSHLINLYQVTDYNGKTVELGGRQLSVSRTYRSDLRQALLNMMQLSVQNRNVAVQNKAV